MTDHDYLLGCLWFLAVLVLGLADLLFRSRRQRTGGSSARLSGMVSSGAARLRAGGPVSEGQS